MAVTVRFATEEDLDAIAEGAAVFEGAIPAEAMRRLLADGAQASIYIWAAHINGELVAVWGAVMTSLVSDEIHIWLIPHRNLAAQAIPFGIAARVWFRSFLRANVGVRITAMVHPDNRRSLRWLTLLGFRSEGSVVVGTDPQLWLTMESV